MVKTDIEEKVKEVELVIQPAQVKGELETILYVPITDAGPSSGYRRFAPSWLFGITVILPLLVGFTYNFIIASERFVSSASFVVRESKNGGGIAAMINGGGLGRSDENSYAVSEFIQSRDAIGSVNYDEFVSKMYGADGVDMFSRFPGLFAGSSKEDFYKHFQHYVDVDFDVGTGITTLSAQGFSAEEAKELVRRLVKASEELVNALNTRAQSDATRFAESLVGESRAALEGIQEQVTAFRNENQMLSADAEVSVSSGLISGLLEGITRVDTEIAQQLASAPNNPRLTELKLRRTALVEQLDKLRRELAGGNNSIAKKLELFETLTIKQKIAQTNLISAEAMLMKARQDSATDKLYLDTVVTANSPDKFGYPQRWLNMALILFIGFSTFVIVSSIRDLIMEEG